MDESLLPGELSVKELYIHPKILTGFKYTVRLTDSNKYLFDVSKLKSFVTPWIDIVTVFFDRK